MTGEHVIETERLQLRRLTLEDAPLMLAIWSDPAFVRYVGDRGVRTEAQARDALVKEALRLYTEHGYGPYRVALRDHDRAIGICGLFRRRALPDADIGYAVLPEYGGKGYAFEAASAVIEHARDEIGLQRIAAIVAPDNAPSIRLLEKLGLRHVRDTHMPDDPDTVCIYGLALVDQDR